MANVFGSPKCKQTMDFYRITRKSSIRSSSKYLKSIAKGDVTLRKEPMQSTQKSSSPSQIQAAAPITMPKKQILLVLLEVPETKLEDIVETRKAADMRQESNHSRK